MTDKPACQTCPFWELAHREVKEDIPSYVPRRSYMRGECKRYPDPRPKEYDDWCGEHPVMRAAADAGVVEFTSQATGTVRLRPLDSEILTDCYLATDGCPAVPHSGLRGVARYAGRPEPAFDADIYPEGPRLFLLVPVPSEAKA